MDRPAQLSEDEYEHIEEAIARTAKGRAFLRRHARHARGVAVDEVRSMLDEFRNALDQQRSLAQTVGQIDVLRRELLEMAGSIEHARREVAALRPPDSGNNKILSATNELDAIVLSTERASTEILAAAERLMDLLGRLRRAGTDEEICADIESQVTTIFTACSFQDLTGQRTSKVVSALRYIEQRVNAMIDIWGVEGVRPVDGGGSADARPDAHLLTGPALEGEGVSQDDVDRMFAGDGAGDPPAPAEAPGPAPQPERPSRAKAKKAVAKEEPVGDGTSPPLDQSAIDALFG